jgi:hypothetical protein
MAFKRLLGVCGRVLGVNRVNIAEMGKNRCTGLKNGRQK